MFSLKRNCSHVLLLESKFELHKQYYTNISIPKLNKHGILGITLFKSPQNFVLG